MNDISPATAVVPRVSFDAAQIDLVKRTLMPKGFGNAELDLFLHHARRTGLDPLARQIYAMDVKGKFSVQVSIDGFRLMAERSGVYAGQLGPQWCGSDGVWRDVWLENEPPAAARVGVLRSDFKEPLWASARFASYAGGYMWQRMPDLMLAKVAEALALRRAFPQELSGLYTADEMEQAGPVESVTPELTTKPANSNGTHKPPQVKPLPKPPEPEAIVEPETGEVSPHLIKVGQTRVGQADWILWGGTLVAAVTAAQTMSEVTAWVQKNIAALTNCERDAPKVYERIDARIREARDRLKESEADFIPAAEEIPF